MGDTVYGYDEMRSWLEEQGRSSVLAVPETHAVWIAGQSQPVGLLAALLPAEAWTVLSAGEGSQGPRLYEWAWLGLSGEHEAQTQGRGGWLLIRRNLSDPAKRATTVSAGRPPRGSQRRYGLPVGAGASKRALRRPKGEVGLDQYEVRGYRAWYRHITLALLAHAVLVVTRAQEKNRYSPSR